MPAVDKYNGKQTVVLRDYVLNRYYRGNFKLSDEFRQNLQFREIGHWIILSRESIHLLLLVLFVTQIVARSNNATWASYSY